MKSDFSRKTDSNRHVEKHEESIKTPDSTIGSFENTALIMVIQGQNLLKYQYLKECPLIGAQQWKAIFWRKIDSNRYVEKHEESIKTPDSTVGIFENPTLK